MLANIARVDLLITYRISFIIHNVLAHHINCEFQLISIDHYVGCVFILLVYIAPTAVGVAVVVVIIGLAVFCARKVQFNITLEYSISHDSMLYCFCYCGSYEKLILHIINSSNTDRY
jgi:hypothetical protein